MDGWMDVMKPKHVYPVERATEQCVCEVNLNSFSVAECRRR